MRRNLIVYRGPSVITGDPIVVAITGFASKSANPKTGTMLQAWILRADMPPTQAIERGADDAICGKCKLRGRGAKGRACYVIWWLGPQQVYRGLPHYITVTPQQAAGHVVGEQLRIGAYGDPAAVPLDVWEPLVLAAGGWTGYTHQWRTCDRRYQQFLMASVDTANEQHEAIDAGWRTFRLRRDGDALLEREIVCPASNEGGHRTTCNACNLCQGGAMPLAKSIAILPHGQRTRWLDQVPA